MPALVAVAASPRAVGAVERYACTCGTRRRTPASGRRRWMHSRRRAVVLEDLRHKRQLCRQSGRRRQLWQRCRRSAFNDHINLARWRPARWICVMWVAIGDLNSDGVTDIVVGAPDDDDGGNAFSGTYANRGGVLKP